MPDNEDLEVVETDDVDTDSQNDDDLGELSEDNVEIVQDDSAASKDTGESEIATLREELATSKTALSDMTGRYNTTRTNYNDLGDKIISIEGKLSQRDSEQPSPESRMLDAQRRYHSAEEGTPERSTAERDYKEAEFDKKLDDRGYSRGGQQSDNGQNAAQEVELAMYRNNPDFKDVPYELIERTLDPTKGGRTLELSDHAQITRRITHKGGWSGYDTAQQLIGEQRGIKIGEKNLARDLKGGKRTLSTIPTGQARPKGNTRPGKSDISNYSDEQMKELDRKDKKGKS